MTFANKLRLFDSALEANYLSCHSIFESDSPITRRDKGMYNTGKFVAYYEVIHMLGLQDDFQSYCNMDDEEYEEVTE